MATQVTVKWGKLEYNVTIDTAAPVAAFKASLYALTAVPPDRQKLMCRAWKGVLKDDSTLAGLALDGAIVSLMGSADGIAKPIQATVFVEDLPPSAAARAGHALPAGLQNLGNTCYANSALQCLRVVPELRTALVEYRRGRATSAASTGPIPALAGALADLFAIADGSTEAAEPTQFLARLRAAYPQFGERGNAPKGTSGSLGALAAGYKQQDAEEFASAIMAMLASELRSPVPGIPVLSQHTRSDGCAPNVFDTLFGIEFEETLTCKESINHMHEGIALGLTGEIEKSAASLGGRNALWSRVARLDLLPRYLCVQMMRFFWKATPDSQDHAGVKCKMLRPVSFPADNFDIFDFTSDRVKAVLRTARERYADEVVLGKTKKARIGDSSDAAGASGTAVSESLAVGASDGASAADDELAAAIRMSLVTTSNMTPALDSPGSGGASNAAARPIGYGLPENFRGLYELFAIVTHKGRSADSGHYMGWRRESGDDWLVFDDDSVSETTTEYVTRELKGGGDQHAAYLLFYRAKA